MAFSIDSRCSPSMKMPYKLQAGWRLALSSLFFPQSNKQVFAFKMWSEYEFTCRKSTQHTYTHWVNLSHSFRWHTEDLEFMIHVLLGNILVSYAALSAVTDCLILESKVIWKSSTQRGIGICAVYSANGNFLSSTRQSQQKWAAPWQCRQLTLLNFSH